MMKYYPLERFVDVEIPFLTWKFAFVTRLDRLELLLNFGSGGFPIVLIETETLERRLLFLDEVKKSFLEKLFDLFLPLKLFSSIELLLSLPLFAIILGV